MPSDVHMLQDPAKFNGNISFLLLMIDIQPAVNIMIILYTENLQKLVQPHYLGFHHPDPDHDSVALTLQM